MSINFQDEFDVSYMPEKVETPREYQKLEDSLLVERDLDSFTDELKSDALNKLSILRIIDHQLVGGWSANNIGPILTGIFVDKPDLKPSERTVLRWRKKYNDSGGRVTSLVKNNHKMGNRETKIKGDDAFFDQALIRFLDAKRPSVTRAYEYYKDLIIITNENIISGEIPIISYGGFLKRIKKLPPYPIAVARHGKFRADQWFNYTSSHIPPTRVLQRVEIDHTPLDLILLDDELNIPLGRPYLTLLVDVFSGCILGFHLSYKSPSYVSAAKAIVHAVKPKSYLENLDIELQNEWPCHGKIETLVVDNGAEFWSQSLEHACLETKINIQYNPVRKPWLKPFVERFFGMINQYFLTEIPGKTFSNIIEKEDYKPEKDAIMRFSTFVNEFHRWIVDIYHQDADSRKTKIPIIRWKQSANSLPPINMTDEESAYFDVIMGVKDTRKLTKHGIKFEELMYDSTALSDYRKQYPQHLNSPKKMIKIDPDDLSKIHVYLEELESYLIVPCTDKSGYTDSLSLHEHKTTKRFNREEIKGKMDSLGLAKARMAMHDAIKNEQDAFMKATSKRKIKSVSQQAKLADISNTGKGSIKIEQNKNEMLSSNKKTYSTSEMIDSWCDDLKAF